MSAWKAWDKQPGAEHTARAMQEALDAVAAESGLVSWKLRDRLMELRLKGYQRAESVEMAVSSES